jgi:uncharacterized protein
MKKIYLSALAITAAISTQAQINFDPSIDPTYITSEVVVPESPLIKQILFIGGVHNVETNATYGNPAGSYPAKEWHDFIGFTQDETETSLGWLSINHEMIVQDDHIGDGGGMTAFRVTRDPNNDTLIVMDQTLADGRTGKFFAVDFVNTVGETGMNCGGIQSSFDGRIWTAEEWFQSSNNSIADRDISDFVIGTGTVNGQAAPAGFPGFNGDTIQKFQNVNWMVEIDPREAVAIRKQYNWGRQGFEGGCILPDNKTVYLGEDGTPGWLSKFVADNAGDFTTGKLYVYKHDDANKWVEIDNTNLDNMLNYKSQAVAAGATMFNRVEWVVFNEKTNAVYFTETGRDNPGNSWKDEHQSGAVHAPHHLARAAAQGTGPDSTSYVDYYGRVVKLDLATNNTSVLIEGGPDLAEPTTLGQYPNVHLTNPDGLSSITINEKDYLLICEDLNGRSYGRVPAEVNNSTCELFMLDLDIATPSYDDLVRIAVVPTGAEITGATATPDGKTLLFNSQHPAGSNVYPYNHSLTIALTGWDQIPTSIFEKPAFNENEFSIYPNPASRLLYFNEVQDIAIYDASGKRIRVERQVSSIDILDLEAGIYFVQNANGVSKKLIVQ